MTRRPTALSVVRRVFPKATPLEANYMLWNRTAYPFGNRRQLMVSLRRLKATIDAGKIPCDHCNRPVGRNGHQCPACARAWRRRR